METLLRNDFTAFYNLPVSATTNISLQTNARYFEIEDNVNRETQIHITVGSGSAVYSNPNQYGVTIINYDKFITGLPPAFHQGKERCDLVVYTNSNQHYFLLNELKDSNPRRAVQRKAKSQLLTSLTHLMSVPTINAFANNYTVKRCCIFNKQPISPTNITAISAFNRLSAISTNGLKMPNPEIEAYGFDLFEFAGGQVFTFQ